MTKKGKRRKCLKLETHISDTARSSIIEGVALSSTVRLPNTVNRAGQPNTVLVNGKQTELSVPVHEKQSKLRSLLNGRTLGLSTLGFCKGRIP